MERFMPLYAIAYAILNSIENEGYFHILVFYTGYFIKEIQNIFSRLRLMFPLGIFSSWNDVIHVSITAQRHVSNVLFVK